VSRAIGDSEFKILSPDEKDLTPDQLACTPVPAVSFIPLGDDAEFILLACDGLFDVCKAQEIVDWVRKHFTKKPLPSDLKNVTDLSKLPPPPPQPPTQQPEQDPTQLIDDIDMSSSTNDNNNSNTASSTTSGTSDTSAPMEVEKEKPSLLTLGDGKAVKGLAEALCQYAVSKRSQDNVSCLIIFLAKD